MQTYFSDLRLWLDHLEIGLRTARGADAAALELEAAREVGESTNPTITTLFEKFEQAAEGLGEESQPSHQLFARRQLHPLLLGSPFLHRCYTKPLGFAGDYEMVNMMLRNPCEGASLFAKVVNVWFLAQPPAEAHRNRIGHLTQQLLNTALRGMREKRTARAISVGCGPAQEVQRFIAGHDVGGALEMTMLDFNEETLAYTRGVMDNLKRRHGRAVNLEYIKKSVAQLIKESGKAAGTSAFAGKFDFVYCAGLFDYLPGQVCQRLMDLMHDWVAPGGMLLATNVASCNPRRLTMDHVMAWHLIYRTGAELAALKPLAAAPEDCRTFADGTGVNIFLEVAKHSRG